MVAYMLQEIVLTTLDCLIGLETLVHMVTGLYLWSGQSSSGQKIAIVLYEAGNPVETFVAFLLVLDIPSSDMLFLPNAYLDKSVFLTCLISFGLLNT